jgi:hypothetical protein
MCVIVFTLLLKFDNSFFVAFNICGVSNFSLSCSSTYIQILLLSHLFCMYSVRDTGEEECDGCGSSVRSRSKHDQPCIALGVARGVLVLKH